MIEASARHSLLQRKERLTAIQAERDADAMIVSHLPDIRWCCGFTGSNGLLYADSDQVVLLTDARYDTQAREEVAGATVRIVQGSLVDALRGETADRLLIQGDRLTVDDRERLVRAMKPTSILSVPGLLNDERGIKASWEIERIRSALRITESVLDDVPSLLSPGITERELAAEIDYLQRKRGAEGIAFDTIVAFSERAALPHAQPGERVLKESDTVLVDTGCRVNGYVSDITRNYSLGPPTAEYARVYEIVRAALETGIEAATACARAREVDRAARDRIETEGLGARFMHSLGHGVGLEIHESPRLSQTSEDVLSEGAVVTVEPGIYVPGRFGIRIEDLVVVRQAGCERLNSSSTALNIVDA